MKYLFSKLLNNRWFYFRKAIIFQSCKEITPETEVLDGLMESIFPASIHQIRNLEGFVSLPNSWKAQFVERLESNNYELYVIRSGNRLAYFSWVGFSNEMDTYLNFYSHSFSTEPYLFHCYTLEEYRGKGLHRIATRNLIYHYSEKNRSLWGIIYDENTPAIKAWERAGMCKMGEIRAFGFFNFKRTTNSVNH